MKTCSTIAADLLTIEAGEFACRLCTPVIVARCASGVALMVLILASLGAGAQDWGGPTGRPPDTPGTRNGSASSTPCYTVACTGQDHTPSSAPSGGGGHSQAPVQPLSDHTYKAYPHTNGYPHTHVDARGRLTPDGGYIWLNPSDKYDFRVVPLPVPGTPHERYPNVVYGTPGQIQPAPGYEWRSQEAAFAGRDYSVVLIPHLMLEGNKVRPEPGYRWANQSDPDDFRVEPRPGTPHESLPHVVYAEHGTFRPAPGYGWANPNDEKDNRVQRLPAGMPHESLPHVVYASDGSLRPAPGYRWSSSTPDDFSVALMPNLIPDGTGFRPEQGYRWANRADKNDFRVEQIPAAGTPHEQYPNVVYGEEGKIQPAPGYLWADPGAAAKGANMAVVKMQPTAVVSGQEPEASTGTNVPPLPALLSAGGGSAAQLNSVAEHSYAALGGNPGEARVGFDASPALQPLAPIKIGDGRTVVPLERMPDPAIRALVEKSERLQTKHKQLDTELQRMEAQPQRDAVAIASKKQEISATEQESAMAVFALREELAKPPTVPPANGPAKKDLTDDSVRDLMLDPPPPPASSQDHKRGQNP